MHELAVTENLLEIALKHAEKANVKRIVGLNIVIGQLASIVDDSVQFYWDIVSQDTPAQGASLHFRRQPAELVCLSCQTIYLLNQKNFNCPQCGSQKVKIHTGQEFFLESIDVE